MNKEFLQETFKEQLEIRNMQVIHVHEKFGFKIVGELITNCSLAAHYLREWQSSDFDKF